MQIIRSYHFASGALLAAWCLLALGCASAPPKAPYPHESILTVVAELKIYLDQDPYRQPPGQDLSGRNIFRVSLERLGTLADLTGPDYADVLAFARGECLERLGDFAGASEAFATAASRPTSLAATAKTRTDAAGKMAGLTSRKDFTSTLEGYLNDLDVLERRLKEWQAQKPAYPYDAYIRQAAEQALEERVRLLFTNRMVLDGASARALQAAGRLTEEHKESYRAAEHWLQLGGLYETLARDWTAQHPPQGTQFKAEEGWLRDVEQARAAYRRVAQADGDPAKLEGQGRLRALDAYAMRIQSAAR